MSSLPIILLTLVIGCIVTIILWKTVFNTSSSQSTIAIVGEMGVGKTLLFHRLRNSDTSSVPKTITSLAPNDITVTPHFVDKTVRIVDVPGHGSYRTFSQSLVPSLSALVFVVDATNSIQIETSASSLYQFLTNPALVKKNVPVLILLNKTDLRLAAVPVTKAKQLLLKALNALHHSKKDVDDLELQNGSIVERIPLTEEDTYDFQNGMSFIYELFYFFITFPKFLF